MHGHGVCRFAGGDVYDGAWERNRMHGRGVERYRSGDVYDGDYREGRMHGHGTYYYADGEAEVGSFKADADVGEGVRWSRDRSTARRLVGGEILEQIGLEDARSIADRVGEPVPDAAPPSRRRARD